MSAKNGRNKTCEFCSKKFYVNKSKDHVRFCSYECAWNDRTKSYSGKNNPYFGRKHSLKVREKMSGENHHKWNGGRVQHPEGYVYILSKNHPRKNKSGYVYEHILVMEKILGRYKWPEEVVHHINGKKHDNRPSNLMLFPNNASHIRYHRLLRKGLK